MVGDAIYAGVLDNAAGRCRAQQRRSLQHAERIQSMNVVNIDVDTEFKTGIFCQLEAKVPTYIMGGGWAWRMEFSYRNIQVSNNFPNSPF